MWSPNPEAARQELWPLAEAPSHRPPAHTWQEAARAGTSPNSPLKRQAPASTSSGSWREAGLQIGARGGEGASRSRGSQHTSHTMGLAGFCRGQHRKCLVSQMVTHCLSNPPAYLAFTLERPQQNFDSQVPEARMKTDVFHPE